MCSKVFTKFYPNFVQIKVVSSLGVPAVASEGREVPVVTDPKEFFERWNIWYPPVIKRGNGKSPLNGGFNG